MTRPNATKNDLAGGLSSGSVRFVRLKVLNDGSSSGDNDIKFSPYRTIISGPHNSGKLAIVNALSGGDPAVDVETEGDHNLIQEYNKIIFMGYGFLHDFKVGPSGFLRSVAGDKAVLAQKEGISILEEIIPSSATDLLDRINSDRMSMGEHIFCSFILSVALRRVLELDVPAVFNSAYKMLDQHHRKTLIEFFKKQSFQQIVIGAEQDLEGEDEPGYLLKPDSLKPWTVYT